jgi:hypothetical protein
LFEVLQHLDRLHAVPHPGPRHRLLLPADHQQNFRVEQLQCHI